MQEPKPRCRAWRANLAPHAGLVALVILAVSPHPAASSVQTSDSGRPASPEAAGLDTPPDSAGLLREARDAQARFERLRVFHSPFSHLSPAGRCDEYVGRFCLRFGSEDPDEERPSWTPPPDPPQVVEGREELLGTLERVALEIPGDRWVLGQWVSYLAEVDRWDEALAVARACEADGWWCHGLEGLALQGLGRTLEAEAAFARVLDRLPEDRREEWEDPAPLVEVDLYRALGRADGDAAAELRRRVWTLADPLFLLEGNPLWTEHMARWVLSETRQGAQNGHGLRWSGDLTELLVRFGPVVSYERVREPLGHMGPPPVSGRYSGESRHLMPSWDAVRDPAASAPEDWRTDRRQARSRHAIPAAPRIRPMDAQVLRFRRGDDLLAVAAWELRAPPEPEAEDSVPPPFPPMSPEAALFAVDPGSLDRLDFAPTRIDGARGVAVARVPAGGYLLSIETLDADGKRAWRHRQGLTLDPLPRGVMALSDLLVLPVEEGVPGLETEASDALPTVPLDSLLVRAVPTARFAPGPVEIVWEVYGLEPDHARLPFHLEARAADRGLLRRAGEALRLLSPPGSIGLEWEEGVPEEAALAGAYLRRVVLDLSGLEPGTYEVTLTLTPPGRTPTQAVRTLELSDAR